ncbi:er lumen protein retaining receptor 1 [Tribonema minus]|uniref:Er lumen protein retaining receptor 1 n=1 Tax=Tribonema minus TaxID=303371 RepID=A0A836CR66_9STRA|nr:er lumen protein retaining receptor 1 [Tribonema minus]|eukprot:TRINITY_DN10942_c0_g1_i1.p1 TRINITY_DN10942_c0_g1~~TRINITY_DN10942_c0_g1_i1.p1  ORF type:complete len:296 (-),score=147.10 TRINITY_DN10942_c0_g1_i1:522-1409(-)
MASPSAYDKLSPRSTNLDLIKQYNSGLAVWVAFFTFVFLIYYKFSDGDFSFLMTYAALTRTFGFALLLVRMFIKQHAKGVSRKTLEMYVLVFFPRLVSILRHEGYLPYDKSGDFIYHAAEMLSMALAAACLFYMHTRFERSYQRDYDTFGSVGLPSHLGTLYMIVPCVVLAVLLHPTLNNDFISDTTWTLSMYMETCAIIPQLYMFQRSAANKGVVEVLVSHSVFALGFARVLDMIFWLYSYHELSDAAGSKSVGMLVLATQFIHIAIMGDFFYYYLISIKTGKAMQLPISASMV